MKTDSTQVGGREVRTFRHASLAIILALFFAILRVIYGYLFIFFAPFTGDFFAMNFLAGFLSFSVPYFIVTAFLAVSGALFLTGFHRSKIHYGRSGHIGSVFLLVGYIPSFVVPILAPFFLSQFFFNPGNPTASLREYLGILTVITSALTLIFAYSGMYLVGRELFQKKPTVLLNSGYFLYLLSFALIVLTSLFFQSATPNLGYSYGSGDANIQISTNYFTPVVLLQNMLLLLSFVLLLIAFVLYRRNSGNRSLTVVNEELSTEDSDETNSI